LQTKVASSAPDTFTDATGRSFVGPTNASLRAAAGELVPDDTAGIWRLPYGSPVGAGSSATAYPGAMLVSTAIPTKDLPASEASDYAKFLQFAAGAGQTPGGGNGQLPDGYLPLTSANGLGDQQHYTEVAAQYVAAQNSKVPDLTNPKPLPGPSPTPTASPTPTPTHPSGSAGGGFTLPPPAGGGSSLPPGSTSSAPSPAPSVSTTPVANTSSPVATPPTPTLTAPLIATILPILALLGLAAGFASPVLSRFAGRRS
jgi:hypothetical protein